jgi:DNA-binding NarL/FixJ family response regulator
VTTRILLCDDQALLRAGFRVLIESADDLQVVGEAATGLEALSRVRAGDVDVVLMDIRMPEVDGIEATRRLVSAVVSTRSLVLTTFAADEYVLQALQAGASGFLLKDAPRASLLAGVRAVAAGDVTLEDSVLKRLVADHLDRMPDRAAPPGLERLTARERQVLHLVAAGQTNGEIARNLFVSETTVKTHVARTLAKLGARDRIQLVVLAHRSGLA